MVKHSITRHHRKPVSDGGNDSTGNISYVQQQQHRAWHLLFKNDTPETIALKLNTIWVDPNYVCKIVRK